MTTPSFDIGSIVPLKYKPLVGLIGAALTFIVPTVLTYSTQLPQPWPWVIAGVVALLTSVGIYKAPYTPQGTVLAPDTPAVAQAAAQSAPTPVVNPDTGSGYTNPWQS